MEGKKLNIRLCWWRNHNVGDELSAYIVRRVAQKLAANTSDSVNVSIQWVPESGNNKLVAVGSMINRSSIDSPSDFWGTGILSPAFKITPGLRIFPLNRLVRRVFSREPICTFHAVRGPLTRAFLLAKGYACPEVYGDPAILLPLFFKPNLEKKHIGLILHQNHAHLVTADKLPPGVRLISINREGDRECEDFISDIASCRSIFSSSLHGLIVAQAYGIPAQWITLKGLPLVTQDNNFKFLDYFSGAGQIVQAPLELELPRDLSILANNIPPPSFPMSGLERLLSAFPKTFLG